MKMITKLLFTLTLLSVSAQATSIEEVQSDIIVQAVNPTVVYSTTKKGKKYLRTRVFYLEKYKVIETSFRKKGKKITTIVFNDGNVEVIPNSRYLKSTSDLKRIALK